MRSIIDRDIARLEESIRALKSRRNELSPISRLPAEVICNIFSLIEEDNITYSGRGPASWSNFSRVSQYWRSTALSAPELWTKIPLSYPRWAKEMLIRSKKAKLTIQSRFSFDSSDSKAIEMLRSCLCEMDRIEELKLPATPGLTLEKIFQGPPKSAPQLRTLCIGSQLSYPYARAGISIYEDFFCDTERLKHVELINCKISWDSQLLTGLTSLNLEDALKAKSSITQLLDALQRMPALTDLRLKNTIPEDSEDPSTYPVVDLHCLRVLHIVSGVGALTTVLRHITIPPSATWNLACRGNESIETDFTNFLSVLATKFLSSLVIQKLRLRVLEGADGPGLEFCLWTTATFSNQLALKWPTLQTQNYVKALTCAFKAMSLPLLTQLHISTLGFIDSVTWIKTFGKLPLLKRVYVQSSASHAFLEALVYKTKAAEKSKAAYRNVSFPKLQQIDLEGIDFEEGLQSTSFDMLLDCLIERYERNAEIQKLCLNDCYSLWAEDVDGLKEVVVDVTWDGIEQGFSDDEEDDDDREYDSEGNTVCSDDLDYEYDYDDFSSFW